MRTALPTTLTLAFFLALAASVVAPARAGQTCTARTLSPDQVRSGLALAHRTRLALDAAQAQAVILGRAGADLSKHGLRFSHAGLALRDAASGQWRVLHLLNHCGRADSGLFEEGLGNFFLDDPFRYEAVALVPSPEVQERVRRTLAGDLPMRLHEPAYSMIANPFALRYQNSNQWLLEVLVAALDTAGGVTTRSAAQAWLKQNAYAPSRIAVSPFERVGARVFRANVRFDDHDSASFDGAYRIVTVESVLSFAGRVDRGARTIELRLQQ